MATRYSKRRSDGTIGYYDSVEEMEADRPEPLPLFAFDTYFATIGFFAGLILACIAFFGFDIGEWLPKWVRFNSIFIAAGIGYCVLGYVGQSLIYVFLFAVASSIIGAILSFIWHLV